MCSLTEFSALILITVLGIYFLCIKGELLAYNRYLEATILLPLHKKGLLLLEGKF